MTRQLNSTMLDFALEHAKRGLRVFPITPNAKTPPLVTGWQKVATTDEKQIRAWWAANPTANVGIECSGMLVVDADAKKIGPDGLDGVQRFDDVARELALEATYEVRTPSQGIHAYYRLPAGIEVKNGVDVLGFGIDIRGSHGYVVAAGSRTGQGAYTVCEAEPIAQADPKLIDLCGQVRAKVNHQGADVPSHVDQEMAARRAKEWLKTREPAVEGHCGDTWTFETCAQLRDLGVARGEMLEVLEEWNSRCCPPWDAEDLQAKIDNCFRYAQNAPGENSFEEVVKHFDAIPMTEAEQAATKEAKEAIRKAQGKAKFKPKTRSALHLKQTTFKPLAFTVNNLLPEGVFLLAASPKIGKSWLTLQIALAVVSGGKVLDAQAVQGEALVLALEDSDRRLKSRLAKLGSEDMPDEVIARLHVETEWPRMNEGGAEALDEWLIEHPDCRYVVVDVLECVRPRRDAKANPYGEDYAALQAFKKIAAARHVTILAVTHVRKQSADDVLQTVSGTMGLTAAADGVIILERQRGEDEGTMHVIARDLPRDLSLAVAFRDGQWTYLGPAGVVAAAKNQRQIVEALRTKGAAMAAAEIQKATGIPRATLFRTLGIMAKAGQILHADDKYTAKAPGFEPVGDEPFGASSNDA